MKLITVITATILAAATCAEEAAPVTRAEYEAIEKRVAALEKAEKDRADKRTAAREAAAKRAKESAEKRERERKAGTFRAFNLKGEKRLQDPKKGAAK